MGDAGQPSITGTAIGQATLTRRSIDEQSASPSDSIGGMAGGSGLLARSGTRPDLPSSATLAEDAGVPGSRGAGSPTGSAAGQIDAAPSTSLAGPNAGFGGPLLKIDAPIGPGSIGSGPPAAIGVRGSSMREGDIAPGTSLKTSSLAKSNVLPILSGGTGEDPREFFKQRSPDRRGSVGQAYGGSPKTEQAVERGIEFLVRHQFPDGHWSIDRFPQASAPGYEDAALGSMNADTAGTGLALLAMLGAGYTHQQGKHHDVVDRGLNWLVRNQQEDGRLTRPQTDRTRYALSYGHAIASIALCEAYGMTRDAKLRAPAERAIQYIINSQDPERGGWRYEARRESDTSVSGWKLMAMKSAQMSGIQVPSTTLQRVSHWLDQAQASGGSLYAYNPYASDTDAQREGRRASLAMTAEGLLMRMWLGWRRDNPALVQGTKTLVANLPDDGAFGQSYRDAYYWYYATQVMFQMQGDGWKAWNDRLLAILPPQQVTEGPLAGSWHPERPTLDRWGKAAGRHYVTCLNLLMLEVYYRHLPLYRPLEK